MKNKRYLILFFILTFIICAFALIMPTRGNLFSEKFEEENYKFFKNYPNDGIERSVSDTKNYNSENKYICVTKEYSNPLDAYEYLVNEKLLIPSSSLRQKINNAGLPELDDDGVFEISIIDNDNLKYWSFSDLNYRINSNFLNWYCANINDVYIKLIKNEIFVDKH